MYLYIGLGLILILILIIIYYSLNSSSIFSSCIYDHNSTNSYIVVENKMVIKNIQDSINKNDNVYYIKGDTLYHNNKKMKRLVQCTKGNMLFMNNKYGVELIS